MNVYRLTLVSGDFGISCSQCITMSLVSEIGSQLSPHPMSSLFSRTRVGTFELLLGNPPSGPANDDCALNTEHRPPRSFRNTYIPEIHSINSQCTFNIFVTIMAQVIKVKYKSNSSLSLNCVLFSSACVCSNLRHIV